MERKRAWKINLWAHHFTLVLAIIILGVNLYDYITSQPIEWFYVGLGALMVCSSVLNIKTAKRELRKEE
ncbi:MAG: hypothetical protein IIW60_06145 [Alistipes sp.]|nr:hypothetical protein [Alistipes sp.]